MSENIRSLSFRRGLDDGLFENYVRLAAETGAPGKPELMKLAEDFLLGEAVTVGACSFYDFLREENAAKKVHVCSGTACRLAGTQKELRENLGNHFRDDEIGEICCLGRCHENGSFQYRGRNYSGKGASEINSIVAGGHVENGDSYSVASNVTPPPLTAEFPGIERWYGLFQDILKREPEDLLDEIRISHLRGRGGAGFPVAVKWESCRRVRDPVKFVICNSDEGDPGSYSDRYLLENRPHSILFGMMAAGLITGAEIGVLYIRAEYPESAGILEKAIRDLEEAHLLGDLIFGSDFSFRIKILRGAGAYICGEETALIASIEGRRPEVGVRPPYPSEHGLFGKPTIVNNPETFACIHPLLSQGGEAFAAIGTEASTGSKLVSTDGFFRKPGVYEVAMGTPLASVIHDLCGGFRQPVKALHIGGPLGGIVPVDRIDDLTLDFESFREKGFLLGHGNIICIPESHPMMRYMHRLFEFAAGESCGKCVPCRIGTVRGKELVESALGGKELIDSELFDDLLQTLEEGSLCALGGGLPIPVRNILGHFEPEVAPCFSKKE